MTDLEKIVEKAYLNNEYLRLAEEEEESMKRLLNQYKSELSDLNKGIGLSSQMSIREANIAKLNLVKAIIQLSLDLNNFDKVKCNAAEY